MRGHVLTLVAALACSPPTVSQAPGHQGSGGSSGGQTGGGAGGGQAGGGTPDSGFGFSVADAGANNPGSVGGAGGACAQSKVGAQQVQVDLLMVLDDSSSMNLAAGARSKWATVQSALVAFVMDPASSGLGVGLSFFPNRPPTKVCTGDADCGVNDCLESDYCLGGQELASYSCFPRGLPDRCPLGGTCTPGGLCAISKQACQHLDAPCSGTPNDVCQRQTRVCTTGGADSCELTDYQQPSVPIAALPGNQAILVGVINGREPEGGTPTGVALRGAYQHVREHLAANPGRRVAVILATDGVPSSCMPKDAPGIAADIRMAQMGTPSILTYVIGVFAADDTTKGRPTVEMFATAGGTGAPYVLDANANLGARLNEALAAIRGQTLPCEFSIPSGTGTIDFGKVNVTLQAAGAEQTIPYVESASRCDPMRGGWYYDVPPATGKPTRILVCAASCSRFKGAPDAKVNLVFGCATEVIF
ncbi:MAG TPA: hypothetical protein VN914_07055 [Polyangia bacterium]|nr:hypothetical protein [Polyangia bacterium]